MKSKRNKNQHKNVKSWRFLIEVKKSVSLFHSERAGDRRVPGDSRGTVHERWYSSLRRISYRSFHSIYLVGVHGDTKSNALVVAIKDGVVLAHEDVSKNPEGTTWGRNIEGHEA